MQCEQRDAIRSRIETVGLCCKRHRIHEPVKTIFATLRECQELLHQKRLQHDPGYRAGFVARWSASGDGVAPHSHGGSSVLLAQKGSGLSAVGELKIACAGTGTDEDRIWKTLAGLRHDELEFLVRFNPDGIRSVPVRDWGYLSSEARGSIPLSDEGSKGVLTVATNFFEFQPRPGVKRSFTEAQSGDKRLVH